MKIMWKTAMAAMLAMATAWASPEAVGNMQAPRPGKAAVFSFGGDHNREFMLDNKPFQIRSGEIHPQRIPRQYWRQRIRAAKAMGLNTVSLYIFWNGLEKPDHTWDFSGSNDIAAFIDLCAQERMWVIFRPGPFVCGEWDLGGMPAYLLKNGEAKLRCTANKEFMDAQQRYMEKMADIAVNRLSQNGGPILMVQLENEYGSYRTGHEEHAYMEWFKDFWTRKGAKALCVSEGATQAQLQYTPKGVALGLNPGENDGAFNRAWQFNPDVPAFSAETYPGWIRHWGEGNWTPARNTLNSVKWFMEKGYSFNLFLLHGGTNFGLTAGSNTNPFNGTAFQPDLTSYDYGAPVGENGNLTKEYHEYREIISGFLPDKDKKLPKPPETPKAMDFQPLVLRTKAGLADLFTSHPGTYDSLPSLEALGQNQGLARYTVTVPAGPEAPLRLTANDYAQVYLDGKPVGVVDRMKGQKEIAIPARSGPSTLEIVLDTFGHVNYGAFIEKDLKGVVGEVKLGDQVLKGWQIDLLPLDENAAPAPRHHALQAVSGGLFYVNVEMNSVADTFLDMKDWVKGYVWVNGHLLGRYWNLGPQERLYCPANFLKKGKNSIVVLDTFLKHPEKIRGCKERNMEVHKQTKALNNQWE